MVHAKPAVNNQLENFKNYMNNSNLNDNIVNKKRLGASFNSSCIYPIETI